MTEKNVSITEKTLVPLSLVITIVGGIVWLSTIYARTDANAAAIDRLTPVIESINQRLAHIEGQFEGKK